MPLETKLVAAKMIAFERRPYFGAGFSALIPVRTPGLGTLACDQYWRMYYDPAVLEEWSVMTLAGAITHELSHLLREHFARSKKFGPTFDQMIGNIAGDLEINDDLIAEVHLQTRQPLTPMPNFRRRGKDGKHVDCGMPLCPKLYNLKDGQLFETYYYQLLEQADDPKSQFAKDFGKQDGNQDGEGDGEGKPDPTQGRCGSCAHGRDQKHQQPAPDGLDNSETPGLTEAEQELIRRQVAKDMNEYKESSTRQGNLPGGWERWAKNYLSPKVNYLAWIRACINNAWAEANGKVDFTWSRPSRRAGAYGDFRLPGMVAPVPQIGIAVDTSGSMSETQLSQCLAEISGVVSQMGNNEEIMVASCDASVHNVQKVTRVSDIKLFGGGGTDMGVALKALGELKPKRDIMIVLTDCETGWPEKRPEGTIVIVQIAGSGGPPPWPCHHVRIEPDAGKNLTGDKYAY